MAEMNVPEGKGKKKGGQRSKKQSTRVDLTAMVDLGFLLITFFMLATTFNKPKTMEINMPDKDKNLIEKQPPLKASKSLTVLLGERDKIYTYIDPENPVVDSTDFSKEGIRATILKRQTDVEAQWGNKDELVVLIKSMPKARYKNLVDILDEMAITSTKRYAIVELDKNDQNIMQLSGAAKE
jgi:biopolymer transport protein ExbD